MNEKQLVKLWQDAIKNEAWFDLGAMLHGYGLLTTDIQSGFDAYTLAAIAHERHQQWWQQKMTEATAIARRKEPSNG